MLETSPLLLAVDAGTTHCKTAVFDAQGNCLQIAALSTPVTPSPGGATWIDPEALWQGIAAAIRQVASRVEGRTVAAMGITSMAESGLLLDRASGSPRTHILPWFDRSSEKFAEVISQAADANQRFRVTGIYPSFKCGLAKILQARDALGADLRGAVWLSVADYLAYRLSGHFSTDYSLAGRTDAFQIFEKKWDAAFLQAFDLPVELFPPAYPASQPVGELSAAAGEGLGLSAHLPVFIAGHDHACAAFAAGVIGPGVVFDSLGTAESLIGILSPHPLTVREQQSGFLVGRHVAGDLFYWQGSLSSAGGSIEWLRSLLPGHELSYTRLDELLQQVSTRPGEVLFFPYLNGSGAPHAMPEASAAFVGLRASHTLGHLLLAVLEGTAYEVEYMRQHAEKLTGSPIETIFAAGGGARNRHWMQIKADVTGRPYRLGRTPELALLGAALVAGVGIGLYADAASAARAVASPSETVYQPDPQRHARYHHIYASKYLPFQTPLRAFYRQASS